MVEVRLHLLLSWRFFLPGLWLISSKSSRIVATGLKQIPPDIPLLFFLDLSPLLLKLLLLPLCKLLLLHLHLPLDYLLLLSDLPLLFLLLSIALLHLTLQLLLILLLPRLSVSILLLAIRVRAQVGPLSYEARRRLLLLSLLRA